MAPAQFRWKIGVKWPLNIETSLMQTLSNKNMYMYIILHSEDDFELRSVILQHISFFLQIYVLYLQAVLVAGSTRLIVWYFNLLPGCSQALSLGAPCNQVNIYVYIIFTFATVSAYITLWRAMHIYHPIDTLATSQYRSTWWQRVKFQYFVVFHICFKIRNGYRSQM
jgi:hypothetical protein